MYRSRNFVAASRLTNSLISEPRQHVNWLVVSVRSDVYSGLLSHGSDHAAVNASRLAEYKNELRRNVMSVKYKFIFLLLTCAYPYSLLGQTTPVIRGDCLKVYQLSGSMPVQPVWTIDTIVCKPPQPSAIPDITVPVYPQTVIDGKLTALDKKIDDLSKDALETVRKTVDAQAIKADDVSRIVKATRDQIYAQLKNDIAKAVQDAVHQSIQEQVTAEVAKQMAAKNKQP